MRIVTTYQKYGWKCKVVYKDVNGKRKQCTEDFYQTISPWNQKTPEVIRALEKIRAEKWAAENFPNFKPQFFMI